MVASVTQSEPLASAFGKPVFRHLSALIIIVVFAADFLTPLGLAHGLFYLPALLLAALSGDRQWLLYSGIVAALLCSLGMVWGLLPEQTSLALAAANRSMSLVAIGAVTALGFALIDLQKRRHLQQQELDRTRSAEKRWRALLDETSAVADVGYWWFDLASEQLHWSEQLCRLHGLAPGEPPHVEGALAYYPEPGRSRLKKAFQQCLNQGIPYSEQLPLLTADGRELTVQTCGRLRMDERGLPVEALGLLHNLAPANLAARQLSEKHRRLNQQLDALPLIVWGAQADGAIDYFNQTLADYSGVSREELSEPGMWLSLLHPDDQQPCARAWMEAVQTGRPYQLQFRIRRFDGEYRWHQVQATPSRDRDGRISKWYGSAVEIPEAAVSKRFLQK